MKKVNILWILIIISLLFNIFNLLEIGHIYRMQDIILNRIEIYKVSQDAVICDIVKTQEVFLASQGIILEILDDLAEIISWGSYL